MAASGATGKENALNLQSFPGCRERGRVAADARRQAAAAVFGAAGGFQLLCGQWPFFSLTGSRARGTNSARIQYETLLCAGA